MSLSFHAGHNTQATTMNSSAPDQAPSGSPLSQSTHRNSSGTGHGSTAFKDSGFFEDEQTNTPRKDYQDFILFDNIHDIAPTTKNAFADTDWSVDANQGSIHEEKRSATIQFGQDISHTDQHTPLSPRSEFFDAVRDAIQQTVNEAITTALAIDYDQETQFEQSRSPPPTPYLRPLELWEHSYERHESIAYRFEQPPHQVQARRSTHREW